MHLSAWRKTSHYCNTENQKAYYSLCQTLKNYLGPSGFDPRIFTTVSDFFPLLFPHVRPWRKTQSMKQKSLGIYGTFTVDQTLIYYILFHIIFIATLSHEKRVTTLGLLKPGLSSELGFYWLSKVYYTNWGPLNQTEWVQTLHQNQKQKFLFRI